MKRLLILLLIMPLCFAASWQEIAGAALMISVSLLAVVYIIGTGFGVNELQMMAKEEFFQVIAVGLMIAALMGTDGLINSMSSGLSPTSDTIQEVSLDIIEENQGMVKELMRTVSGYDLAISRESSKSSQCNIVSMGYSVSGCGGYSMIAPPLATAGGIVGFALGELSAMERLLQISEKYALALLLPVGIVLRTFKVTRGAGGFLIALGVAMHIMLPIGVIFNEMLAASFLAKMTDSGTDSDTKDMIKEYDPSVASFNPASIEECDAGDTSPSELDTVIATLDTTDVLGGAFDSNEDKAARAYMKMRQSIRNNLYVILLKATFGPAIALLLMMTSIRALTSLAGAEVDVSSIGRFI